MTASEDRQLREVNEALLVSSVHQHELTEAAEKAHAKYRMLFDSIDEGFCVIEKVAAEAGGPIDFRYLEANPAFATQSGLSDVVGKTIRQVVPGEPEAWFLTYDAVLRTGEPIRFERELVTNGRVLELYAFRIEIDHHFGVAVIFKDITERARLKREAKEHAQALADLHRRKDEFLAMLGHELRNPLAPISNAVQLLRLQKNEDHLQRQARTIIERQVGQLKHLIDDLLEISRITTGRIHLHRERVTLGGVVENAVETVRPLIGQRRHALKVVVPTEAIWLHADAARLEQVVVNLLTNAAKYTDDGGHIWLGVQQEGNEAVLRVRDTGVGIGPELLPRIFDLFTQAERSLARSQGGLGVGLALVQRLVDMHEGRVEVSSVIGQGSEFVVRLPVAAAAGSIPPPAARPPEPTGPALRVLVVDDNLDAAESLAVLLGVLRHDVRLAHDGLAAVAAAAEYRPDVVLLDIGLPKLDGYEAAKRIRDQLAGVVLVALTGYGLESDRRRAAAAGFDHHLVKPADFGTVREILATVAKQNG